jgi:hypothetical protein
MTMTGIRQYGLLQEIVIERERQEILRNEGRFSHTAASATLSPSQRYAIVGEEFGELGGAVLAAEKLATDRTGTSQRKELIQLAAVCLAWLEYLADA